MKKHYLLVSIAWFIFLLAWTLPVHKHGVALPEGLPGCEALGISLAPLWDHLVGRPRDISFAHRFLSTLSGGTNLLMIGSGYAVFASSRRVLNTHFLISVAAALINGYWFLFWGFELRIGYFMWWLSFLVLAVGIHALLTAEGDELEQHQSLVSQQELARRFTY